MVNRKRDNITRIYKLAIRTIVRAVFGVYGMSASADGREICAINDGCRDNFLTVFAILSPIKIELYCATSQFIGGLVDRDEWVDALCADEISESAQCDAFSALGGLSMQFAIDVKCSQVVFADNGGGFGEFGVDGLQKLALGSVIMVEESFNCLLQRGNFVLYLGSYRKQP